MRQTDDDFDSWTSFCLTSFKWAKKVAIHERQDRQKVLLDNASRAFDANPTERERPSREGELEERIAQLEAKLARKDNIIAEISEEYVALKKEIGEP